MRIFKALEEKKKKEQEEQETEHRKNTLIKISNIKKYETDTLLPTLNYIITNVPVLVEQYKSYRTFSFTSKGPLDVSILHELKNNVNVLQNLKYNNEEYLYLKSTLKPLTKGGGNDSQLLKYADTIVNSAVSIKDMYQNILIYKERKNNKAFNEKLREQYNVQYNKFAVIFYNNFKVLSTALILNLQKFIGYFEGKLSKYSIKTSREREHELAVEREIEKHNRIQDALARQLSSVNLSGGKKYKKTQKKNTKKSKKTAMKKKLVVRKTVKSVRKGKV
jgi:hypothetical protein